jgi:hypothetical protein
MLREAPHAADSRPFADLNHQWQAHNRGPDGVSAWPQATFYLLAFVLTAGWRSADLWTGKCGTAFATYLSVCTLFGLVALGMSAWAGVCKHNRPAAARFLVSGMLPLISPWLADLSVR